MISPVGDLVPPRGSGIMSDACESKSLFDHGSEKLASLCEVLWPRLESNPLLDAFRRLARPWSCRPIGAAPEFHSNIADDHAPFEFSVAFSRGDPEIQFYVEPLGVTPSAQANMLVARALVEQVAAEVGTPLDAFWTIEDLFLPSAPLAPFSLWIGCSWSPGKELLLKTYLNPQVRGRAQASELVADAMQKLGFAQAWSVARSGFSRHEARAELAILCLDLAWPHDRRVKVYVRHHAATLEELASVASVTREHGASGVATFYSLLGDGAGPFTRKPPITELSFLELQRDRPSAVTLEFPIGSYVTDDEMARARIERCFSAFGLDPEPYRSAISRFAGRELAARAGLHAHVTLRQLASGPRLAIYLTSEAYAVRHQEVGSAVRI